MAIRYETKLHVWEDPSLHRNRGDGKTVYGMSPIEIVYTEDDYQWWRKDPSGDLILGYYLDDHQEETVMAADGSSVKVMRPIKRQIAQWIIAAGKYFKVFEEYIPHEVPDPVEQPAAGHAPMPIPAPMASTYGPSTADLDTVIPHQSAPSNGKASSDYAGVYSDGMMEDNFGFGEDERDERDAALTEQLAEDAEVDRLNQEADTDLFAEDSLACANDSGDCDCEIHKAETPKAEPVKLNGIELPPFRGDTGDLPVIRTPELGLFASDEFPPPLKPREIGSHRAKRVKRQRRNRRR